MPTDVDDRRWLLALGGLAALRMGLPLAALGASGRQVPGFPPYTYGPVTGDGPGYLSTARALISAAASLGPLLAVLTLVGAGGAWATVRLWRRNRVPRHWLLAGSALLVFGLLAAAVTRVEGQAPAGAVGWPLLLALVLFPFRVLDRVGPDVSFGAGLGLALLANTVSVVATGFVGLFASGSRRVGLLAAALFALWPVLVWALLGSRTWENGTWIVDTGLALYSEPVSTACVAAGLALVLAPGRTPTALVAAGIAFGYAFAVRPTNLVFAVAAVAGLASARAYRSASYLVAGALTVAPVVLAFAPKRRGYELAQVRDEEGVFWSFDYLASSFADSSVWRPELLALLLPPVAIGLVAARSRAVGLTLLGGTIANAAIYACFRATAEHPRYLFAGLPALLALWSTGALAVARRRPDRPT